MSFRRSHLEVSLWVVWLEKKGHESALSWEVSFREVQEMEIDYKMSERRAQARAALHHGANKTCV
jgi:hypothetical protein